MILVAALAQSAAAYTLHQCEAKGSGGTGILYTTACAAESDEGTVETVPLEPGKATEVRATGTTSFTLSAVVGGVRFTITCTGLESSATATNGEAGGRMLASGEGPLKLTGCSVTAPAGKGCTVPGTIEMVNLQWATTEAGSTEFRPAEGERFATVSVTGCSAEALNGNKEIKGTLVSARETASTQAFSSTSGSELIFGGQEATFIGSYHLTTPTGDALGLESS